MASILLPPRRLTFAFKVCVAVALVVVADMLFYQRQQFGGFIGLFALIWLVGTAFCAPAFWRRRSAWIAALCAAMAGGALVFDPSLLAWTLFWTALSMAALLPATGRFDDGWRWFQRLLIHAVRSIAGPIADVFRLRRIRRDRRVMPTVVAMLPVLVLPIAGSAVILLLFALANPVIGDALGAISLPEFSPTTIARSLFWAILFTLVWGTLRPRRASQLLATFDGSGDVTLAGVSLGSVTLSLVLFNLLFALQNALDIAYLWGGLPLPHGMTLAEYAHRGAYPLIATALLAGLFVIVTLRPGSQTAANPRVRRLLVLWIAQNILLVASTILRTLDYVDAYSLTRLRIAALAWMGLVALGLVLICWRMLRGKSSAWLINSNLIAAGSLLMAFCFVDTGAVAAAWNVRHAREVGGRGTALDLCYLNAQRGSALISLVELEQRRLAPQFGSRVRAVRQRVMADLAYQQNNGGWTWRNAQRLAAARQRIGQQPDIPVPGQRDCAGRLMPPPEPQLTPDEAETPSPATPPAPLTPEAQR